MKRSHLLGALCACLLTFTSMSASAAVVTVVDQSQLSFNSGAPFDFGGGTTNYPLGQSFTAGSNALLAQIDVFSNGQLSGSNAVTMELRSGAGTGGTLLGTVTQSVGPNSYDYGIGGYLVSINTLGLGIDLIAGDQYTFLFTNVTGTGDFAQRGVLLNDANPYAGGSSYFGAGYGNQPGWDLMFQTQVSAVPVPAAAWLFGSGLIGLIGVARRKARA